MASRPRPVLAFLLALGAAVAPWRGPASAQDRSLEYPVKAAFLYRFGSYVAWPASAFPEGRSPVQVCVVGRDPFGEALDRVVQGQTLDGRPIAVRRLEVIGPGSGCHIAYLGGSPEQSPAAAARAVANAPVLTVGEEPAADGAAIQFVLRGARVRFRIDLRAAAHAGLGVSSKLLNIAVEVAR